MKNLIIGCMILLFGLSNLGVLAQDDDCPCRRKVVTKVVTEKKKAEPPKKPEIKNPLFIDFYSQRYEESNCPKGLLKEYESYKVKIMPNPVMDILNIIYTTPYKSLVTIELLSCEGRLIKTLLSEVQEGGMKVRTFEVEDLLKRGIAYVRIVSPKVTKTQQIFKL